MTYYPGQGFTIRTDFDVTLDAAPHYELRRDTDGALVIEGIAEQDSDQTQRWTADIVLPEGVTEGSYTIEWLAKSGSRDLKNIERFKVGEARSDYAEIDRLFREGQPLSDLLLVDEGATASDFNVSVRDSGGNVLFQNSADPRAIESNGNTFYCVNFDGQSLSAGSTAFACYVIQWDFCIDGMRTTEYHFVYVANHKTLMYVNELRRMIDKPQLQQRNPGLRYNDVDLVAFLNLGLQTINVSPPTQTSYSLASIPDNLFTYVLNAAAVQALDSRYLAEAEAAFNFTGQPISLDVDRTGFIDSAISRYQSALDDLKTVKKNIVMTTGSSTGGAPSIGTSAGVLVLSKSPSMDYSGLWQTINTNFRPGSRAIFYDEFLNSL